MKALATLALAVLLVLAGWLAAGPYLVSGEIREGIRAGDAEALARHVDFDALRADIKGQLKASIARQAQADRAENPYAALAQDIAMSLVDGVVEGMVTPVGLARLSAGASRVTGEQPEPFANATYAWESHDRFAIHVPGAQGKEVVFVLTRAGLTWRLTGIRMPVGG